MTPRRSLDATLVEVAAGALDALAGAPALTLRSISVVLPLEITVRRNGPAWDVLGDVPRTLTRTAFDTRPCRLEVTWVPGGAA